MRIVIDTNIIASAIYYGGKPTQLLQLLMGGQIDAVASNDIVKEYDRTIQKLQNKYPTLSRRIPLADIVSKLDIINVSSDIKVCRDPDDDKFISCAVDGKCFYIVSGDKDLLSLEKYGGVEIIAIAEFFERYYDHILHFDTLESV